MAITVELDIYSGMPNPSWQLSAEEENELVERIVADRSLIAPLSIDAGGLGYRGFIATVTNDDVQSAATQAGLPATFRIGGSFDRTQAASQWLLETAQMHDSGVDEVLVDVSEAAIDELAADLPFDTIDAAGIDGAGQTCSRRFVTSDTNFSFWNGSSYLRYNNCYNFASNYRTNTFAQPGRKTGSYCTSGSCMNVATYAYLVRRDGWKDSCLGSPAYNISICLVIWPGRDFHFYRLCANGHWCHKPGQTAARNYDNSRRWITAVETCNRGSYTQMGGYYYANRYMVVR